MTQEEKAKRYDKALEIAKKNYIAAQDLHEGSQIGVECFKNTLENIFPELKESEDERIRKEIIQFIKKRDRSGCDYDYDQWITWLEKQDKKPQGKTAFEAINNINDKGYCCVVKSQDKSALKSITDNELVEEVYSYLDSIKETADRMTSGNFMHNKAAIKLSVNTITQVLELIGIKKQDEYPNISPQEVELKLV